MLGKILKLITAFSMLSPCYGCIATQPIPSVSIPLPAEESLNVAPHFNDSKLLTVEQMKQILPESNDIASSPCIKGPKAMRFIDSFWKQTTMQPDVVDQFINYMPPLVQQRFLAALTKCQEQLGDNGGKCNIDQEVSESLAKEYIAGCYDQISRYSSLMVMLDSPYQDTFAKNQLKAVETLWRSNLDFMKWWLVNLRQN